MAMKILSLQGWIHAAGLALVAVGCSGAADDAAVGTTSTELVAWVQGNFSQVLRVNANETTVRNICELTIPLASKKPLAFVAVGSTGGGTSSASLGWSGSAVSGSGMTINGCTTYPCEVTARWRGLSSSGSTLGCNIVADDGSSQLEGDSSGTTLTVAAQPTAPIIFNQDVKIGAPNAAISGSCVFRQSAQLPGAQVSNFKVFANGVNEVSLSTPFNIGNVAWSTNGPAVPFGALYIGSESAATRLKHVTPKSEQLVEGNALRCDGRFYAQSGVALFDVNVSGIPSGNGMSLRRGTTAWTCSSGAFGSGDVCDCDCGIVDPDCASDGSALSCGADVGASQDIAAVLAAADGVALSLAVHGAIVTYEKPVLGSDPAGFFLQAEQAGPALFVAIDPATLTPSPEVGDKIDLTVTGTTTVSGMKQAIGISGFSVLSRGNSTDTLVANVSSSADLVSNLSSYAGRAVSFSGTISNAFTAAGSPQVAATLATTGLTDPNLRLRIPETVRAAFDLEPGCTVNVDYGFMWPFNAVAELSSVSTQDFASVTCPAPTVATAVASSSTEVYITFSRAIDSASIAADGSQFIFDNGLYATAAIANGNVVTVTTSGQFAGAFYNVFVAASVKDILGTEVGAPNSASFTGFLNPASVLISELNANISNGCDLIELRVVSGGSMHGFTLLERTQTIFTAPNVDVTTGDKIVIHINGASATCNPGGATNETTSVNQYSAATFSANYDFAFDWYSSDTGLVSTDSVLWVKTAYGAILDAVFVADNPTGTAATDTETAAAEVASANQWTMVGGGVPIGGFIDDAFRGNAVLDLNGTSNSVNGTTIQRVSATDTNTLSDWTMAPASWGL